MKHDITFNNRDELLSWMDENFPDALLAQIESNGARYETDDCTLETNGINLTLTFKTI
jgi:hypothetical protein